MANQAAAAPAPPLGLGAFSQLNARQKLTALVLVALAIALLVGALLWTREPPYSVLFSNLSDQDGGQIVAALQQRNIPYKHTPGGGAILVPSSQVHDIRLQLASQGLPKGGLVGFELMENQKLGISQFAEHVNYQRGLEGELARSIQTLGAVRAARVHLAIPKQTAFLRDELKPSASVLVSLQAGRTLDPGQVAGIVHLVSSSVPQLSPSNISVIDQDGKLISQEQAGLRQDPLDPRQLGYVKAVEAQYVRRVETILEPLLGRGNFRTQVAAEIDFSQVDQVEEIWQPNPAPNTAIRSQQTAESGSASAPALGVPGALTNQPPVPATAPLTSPPVGGAGGGGAGQSGNFSRNVTTNYELDKTVRHTRATPGGIKRLSIAVAVNHQRPIGSDGTPGRPVPPSAEELQRIGDLVRESVGFNEQRGDTINVASASFVQSEPIVIPETPLWQDPAAIAYAKEALKYLVFALIVWLVWSKLLKPVFEMLTAAAQRAAAERRLAAEAAPTSGAAAYAGGAQHVPNFDDKLQAARDSAQQEPKLIADLIKGWMGGSGT